MQGNTSSADLVTGAVVPADTEELPQVLELVHSNAAILTLIAQVIFPLLSWIDTKVCLWFMLFVLFACSFSVHPRRMLCSRH
jgi:hypothetical protein